MSPPWEGPAPAPVSPWRAPRREPALNLPWPVSLLIAALLALHLARTLAGAPASVWAFAAADLVTGRAWTLVTYQFVHGSWAHVAINSAFTLAFGAPVARFLGRSAWAGLVFFAFFLACGVIAALGYDAVARSGGWSLVGASGAASGLMGAAARLIEGRGRLGSPIGRTALGMSLGWIAINALLGLSGLTPGAAGAPVAWQAHIVGYFAGMALVSPAAALTSRRPERGGLGEP